MSEAKHTPGPWVLETVRTSCGICHKVGPFPGRRENDEPRHACIYADYPSKHNPADAELEANAILIAAAPDLLDALKALTHSLDVEDLVHDDQRSSFAAAIATIAKATGGSA